MTLPLGEKHSQRILGARCTKKEQCTFIECLTIERKTLFVTKSVFLSIVRHSINVHCSFFVHLAPKMRCECFSPSGKVMISHGQRLSKKMSMPHCFSLSTGRNRNMLQRNKKNVSS